MSSKKKSKKRRSSAQESVSRPDGLARDRLAAAPPMARGAGASKQPLLIVDGYNVIHGTPRYERLIDEHPGAGALADVAHLSRDPYGHDPHERSRAALIADVAAYAQRSYEAVIVFDGAGNLSDERPNFSQAGVKVVFSRTGESADSVIERLATRARREEREVLLVSSDNAVRATVGGVPVTAVSSRYLHAGFEELDRDLSRAEGDAPPFHMTLGDRLRPEDRAKLREILGW